MLVSGFKWNSCDICWSKVPSDHSYVARGATGRYCPVLSVCSACAEKEGGNALTYEQALAQIAEKGDGYADF